MTEPRRIRIWRIYPGRWGWRCTRCQPAVVGSTSTWQRALRSVHHHYQHRRSHHSWVAGRGESA